MKFVCSGMELSEGLKRVGGALPNRTVNQVLEGVKIEAVDEGVRLTASDERTTIVTTVAAIVEEEGAGVAPGKLLTEVVRGLVNGDVTVSMNQRFAFTVKGGGSRTNLAGQDAELYPALPEVSGEHEIQMPRGMLRRMIDKTAFCVAVEDTREVLTGAALQFVKGKAYMVGLDGFRMAMCEGVTSVTEDFEAIIPGKALTDLGKLLGEGGEDDVIRVDVGGGKLRATVDGTDFYATLIKGEFINWRNIMPKAALTKVVLDTAKLRRAVDRAALIARQGHNNLLVLRIQGDRMAVEARSEVGDVHETVDVETEGAALDIAFNVKYLADMLKNADSAEIAMNMNGAIAPCTVTAVGGGDMTYMVLPVRTGATQK